MPPETTPPSEAAVQAAADAAAATEPPAPEPEPEIEDLPEGTDSFDRPYVEKLRGEAAKYRTRARTFEAAFTGYSDQERDRFLELAGMLSDPNRKEQALEEFRGVTERLAKQLGKELPTVTETAPEPEQAPEPAETGPSALTEADIDRLVEAKLAAAQQRQAQEAEVQATFAEAEALSSDYTDPAAKAYLFATARQHQTDLAGAHEIIQQQRQAAIDAAVEEFRSGLASGRQHPPRLPAGDPANAQDQGPPKTIEEASRRAKERLRAAGLG